MDLYEQGPPLVGFHSVPNLDGVENSNGTHDFKLRTV